MTKAKKDITKQLITHSAWTGKKYDKPKTHAEVLAESMAVLRKHPTIGKLVR